MICIGATIKNYKISNDIEEFINKSESVINTVEEKTFETEKKMAIDTIEDLYRCKNGGLQVIA